MSAGLAGALTGVPVLVLALFEPPAAAVVAAAAGLAALTLALVRRRRRAAGDAAVEADGRYRTLLDATVGGTITVASAPGRGTTFSIYLPLADCDLPAASAEADSTAATPAAGGAGTVLLVEDQPALCELERHDPIIGNRCPRCGYAGWTVAR
jgi:hypothetical protein